MVSPVLNPKRSNENCKLQFCRHVCKFVLKWILDWSKKAILPEEAAAVQFLPWKKLSPILYWLRCLFRGERWLGLLRFVMLYEINWYGYIDSWDSWFCIRWSELCMDRDVFRIIESWCYSLSKEISISIREMVITLRFVSLCVIDGDIYIDPWGSWDSWDSWFVYTPWLIVYRSWCI